MKNLFIRFNRIQNKIGLGFLVVVIFFVFALISVIQQLSSFERETRLITDHDMQVHSLAQSIEKDLVDMETGQRGFVITGENKYLEPYTNGKVNWQRHYDALYQLVADNPDQQENLKAIRENVEHWIQSSGEEAITLKKANDNKGIQQFFQNDPGKEAMDSIREQLSSFRSMEKQLTMKRVADLEKKNGQLRLQLYGSFFIILIVSVISAIFTGTLTTKNVRKVEKAIAEIASSGGNLTKRITVKTKDETKDLADQTNLMLSSLQNMITDIQGNTLELERSSSILKAGAEEGANSADQISESVRRVAQGAEHQVSQAQEMSAILQQMVSGLEQVAVTSVDASKLAKRAQSVATRSAGEMRDTAKKISKMEETFSDIQASALELASLSEKIRDVVTYIQEVSTQTNLLSLNAAIEAARAGDQGQGFAVVAGEIRKLADQAAYSTREIHETIEVMLNGINGLVQKLEENSRGVKDGIQAMLKAGDSFQTITNEVDSLSVQVMDVASSVGQMSVGSKAIEGSIREITRITEETASFAEEVSAMTEEQAATSREMFQTALQLNEMSDSLKALVGRFKV
ncbi:methyl-accepting chemotaxis protein [Paenibacillus sp. MB22_1]|uniref:methyl-accepting chemotaxis protein n=1 Tax=Paenibacillus sp. MB22_1 TaxID=3383121 RepID=UPI0039A1AD91